MSRYDYRDPACDPLYCDGLGRFHTADEVVCVWCQKHLVLSDEWAPYCSASCQCTADIERRR